MNEIAAIRVSALELPARFGEPEAALADARALLASGPETDVVLLPEASLTGYVDEELHADLRPFAEPLGGPTTERLGALAREHRVHLVGPLVLQEGRRLHNSMVALRPDGTVACVYRKRHPWYLETWADRGEEPLGSFTVGGVRFAIAVCYDVHFLPDESADDLRAADVLLFPSAWVERHDTRPRLLSDLARDFGVAVVNANWGPGAPGIYGQGASRIVDQDGTPLAVAPRGPGPKRIDATLRRRTGSA